MAGYSNIHFKMDKKKIKLFYFLFQGQCGKTTENKTFVFNVLFLMRKIKKKQNNVQFKDVVSPAFIPAFLFSVLTTKAQCLCMNSRWQQSITRSTSGCIVWLSSLMGKTHLC